jgi:hypothetical protein
VDQPVLQLHVEVPPRRGPRRRLEPWPRRRHRRRVPPGGGRHLVQLDPVEALQPTVRNGQEATAVVAVPPVAVRLHLGVLLYGTQRPRRRCAVGVGPGDAGAQATGTPEERLSPRRRVLASRKQRLRDELDVSVPLDGRRRIRLVAGGRRLAEHWIGTRADRDRGVERPPEGALPLARGDVHAQQRPSTVDEGAQAETAGGRGDGTAQFGVPQVQPPVDPGDRAHRLQRQVPDGQPRQPEQRPVLGPVVLHLAVPDSEPHGVGAGLGVDAGTEEPVAEERTLVPRRRHPPPDEVGGGQESRPRHPLVEPPAAPAPARRPIPGPTCRTAAGRAAICHGGAGDRAGRHRAGRAEHRSSREFHCRLR